MDNGRPSLGTFLVEADCFRGRQPSIDWLIDWLADWLTDWPTDWLIDWLFYYDILNFPLFFFGISMAEL